MDNHTSRNHIVIDQNSDHMLKHLAAQRYLYSRAKAALSLQFAIVVILAVVLATLGAVCPRLVKWAALYGIGAAIADAMFLEKWKKRLQWDAARVQEAFDCEVFKLEWNGLEVGSRPDIELINEAASEFARQQDSDQLKDWYPLAVRDLPLCLARLVCQRSNCQFDKGLRSRFSGAITGILCVSVPVVFVIALLAGLDVEQLVLVILAPLLPLILWAIREVQNQKQAIDTLDRLKNTVNNLWENVLKGQLNEDQCAQESRKLQDAIFAHRSTSPLIFDFVYRSLRQQSEETMNRSAEDLLAEAFRALGEKN